MNNLLNLYRLKLILTKYDDLTFKNHTEVLFSSKFFNGSVNDFEIFIKIVTFFFILYINIYTDVLVKFEKL